MKVTKIALILASTLSLAAQAANTPELRLPLTPQARERLYNEIRNSNSYRVKSILKKYSLTPEEQEQLLVVADDMVKKHAVEWKVLTHPLGRALDFAVNGAIAGSSAFWAALSGGMLYLGTKAAQAQIPNPRPAALTYLQQLHPHALPIKIGAGAAGAVAAIAAYWGITGMWDAFRAHAQRDNVYQHALTIKHEIAKAPNVTIQNQEGAV